MLDILNKDDYRADSVHKNLVIELDDGTLIDNANIKSESMKLNEILMDGTQLKFGRCNSSQFGITLGNVDASLKDKVIKPYLVVGGNEVNKSAEGNPITITDSGNQPFIEFKEDGYIIQDGTPTPDAPVEIQGLGDSGSIEVKTCKKNLYDANNLEVGLYTYNNGVYKLNTNYKHVRVDIGENEIFTRSYNNGDNIGGGYRVTYFDSEGNVIGHKAGNGLTKPYQTFTTPSGCAYMWVYGNVDGEDTRKVQVELGDTHTSYEPYEGTVANIPIDSPLYEGDYIERFADGTGQIVRKYEKVVFNGTESWSLGGSNTLLFTYVTNSPKDKLIEVYCSHYQSSTKYWTLTPYNQCGFIGDNIRQFCIKENNYTNATDFKTWLQANHITVVYELAEPIVTALTAEQLAEIEKLHTFESTTNVFTESNTTIKYRYNKALPLGVFTVKEVPRLSQTSQKQVTALDNMHKIDVDVTEWYSNLTFPMTQKAFRDSFFEYIGLDQVETELLFDDLVLNNPFADVGQINGRIIAEGLCELNATFGHCDREGKFKYVSLKYDGLYPTEDLYPADDVYPGMLKYPSDSNEIIEDLNNLYIKTSYDEFETQFIERILVIDDYGSQLANSDDTTANTYVINNNYLLYNRGKAELLSIMNKFMDKVKWVAYRPASIESKGLPYIELGDRVRVNVKDDEILTYVFNRTLTGIQALRDTYSADGEEYLVNDLNSIQVKMENLNRKTDRLKIEVTATAKGLESKVSKGNVSTEISQESDEIRITGNRFVVDADNLSISADGSLVANNGKFKGTINADKGITMFDNEYGLEGIRIYPGIVDIGGFEPVTDSAVFLDGVKFFCLNTDYLMGSQAIFDKITINGTKSRQIETYNYGNRLEYCYEMPTPYFGDVGEGIIDNEGICYIFLDDIFAETIDTNCEYQVFLQAYGEGTVYVNRRNSSYFVVKGTPNMKFAWEIKAVQRDYEMYRLDEPTEKAEETTDYAEESYDYLASLLYDVEQESEVIINE